MTNYNDIPQSIFKTAIIMCKEPFWPYPDVLNTIDKLSELGYAIVGVELFEKEDDSPKWITTSHYDHEHSNIPWKNYIELCRQSATEFIFDNMSHPEGLFNLSWCKEGEIERLRKKLDYELDDSDDAPLI